MEGLVNAIQGTLFTWFLTALGSAAVLVVPGNNRPFLDLSLGFSGGVMLAASYWSLLEPALTQAEDQGWGKASCVPVTVGVLLGAGFVLLADIFLPENITSVKEEDASSDPPEDVVLQTTTLRQRKVATSPGSQPSSPQLPDKKNDMKQLRRLILLIIAITVHNFPEGLAVGVGYASVGRPGVSIQQAHNLALGIGLQNFPEGLAVSVPLKAAGFSTMSSFFWGQASGMVEPIAGVIGVICVTLAEQVLALALAFAAGAMIWVVCNDIIPEAATQGNTRLCSYGITVGFVIMMSLDTALTE